jgi:hypothetical protein
MATPRFHINQLHFGDVVAGWKLFEGKPPGARIFKEATEGDIVEFWTHDPATGEKIYERRTGNCWVRLAQILDFESIEAMLRECGVERMLPELTRDPDRLAKGIAEYKRWRDLSDAPEDKGNDRMRAIKLEVVR